MAALLVILAVYSAFMIIAGMSVYRAIQTRTLDTGLPMRTGLRELPAHLLAAIGNHVTELRSSEPLEKLHLDIAFKDVQQLRAKRAEALRVGMLVAEEDDLVPATIRHDDRSVRTKIRLKGDLLDHLYGDKWSFRVEVRKSDQLFGMRRFSLQAPRVRDNQAEPIFLEHLRREGILTPRYFFVRLFVNGKDVGVMAVEEHFSKELLESQQRKEGLILRFDESRFWNNRLLNGTFGPFANPQVAMLRPFRGGKVAKSPLLASDHEAAVGLMRGFLAGELTPQEVFDVELMARFMAVADVWNAHHSLAWHNLRFYFNPLIARFEPVVFDGHLQARPLEPGLIAQTGAFTHLLLADDAFRGRFVRTLARIAGEMADGGLADWARQKEQEILPRIQEGLEYLPPLPIDFLVERARSISQIDEAHYAHYLPPLGSPTMEYPEPIDVFLCADCSPPRLEFVNALPVPVRVTAIRDAAGSTEFDSIAEAIEVPIEVPATEFMGVPTPSSASLGDRFDPLRMAPEVTVVVDGQTERHTIRARPYFDRRTSSPMPAVSLEEALQAHPFLRAEAEGQALRVVPGAWDVSGSLVLPEGASLRLEPGTTLRFSEGQALIATGPLRFEGTAAEPVVLEPQAGHATWAGVAAVRSEAPHVWKHVVVRSTMGISRKGWRLTGGVTLRATHVEISDSLFEGHRGEDAVNLIRTTFAFENVEIRDTKSDALDADFSDGVIRGGRFSQIEGDGIDVSGAEIEVDGVELVDVTDKAISVGEASRLVAKNLRIDRVGTGAASKDRSRLELFDSIISDAVTAGVSVFTKKPEYGPAWASLERVEMRDLGVEVLVQTGSHATMDGVVVAETALDTSSLY